jgi:hypothetical protein
MFASNGLDNNDTRGMIAWAAGGLCHEAGFGHCGSFCRSTDLLHKMNETNQIQMGET